MKYLTDSVIDIVNMSSSWKTYLTYLTSVININVNISWSWKAYLLSSWFWHIDTMILIIEIAITLLNSIQGNAVRGGSNLHLLHHPHPHNHHNLDHYNQYLIIMEMTLHCWIVSRAMLWVEAPSYEFLFPNCATTLSPDDDINDLFSSPQTAL